MASTLASYGANLNYRSPSQHHPGLGISVRKVVKRNNPASKFSESQLNFTHGVASGDPFPNSVIIWSKYLEARIPTSFLWQRAIIGWQQFHFFRSIDMRPNDD